MACEAMIHITREDRERARKLSEDKYILDTQSMRVSAWKEGLQEGLQKGLKEGEKKEKFEIARKLKGMTIPVSQIAESTGLTVEDIEKL